MNPFQSRVFLKFKISRNVIILILLFSLFCRVNIHAQQLQTSQEGYKWYEIEKRGYVGVKNLDGKTIVPAKYTYIRYDDNGYFIVETKKGYKECYDVNGRKIIDGKGRYSYILPMDGGDGGDWFLVSRNGFEGAYIRAWGEVIPPNKFTFVRYRTDCHTNLGTYGRKGYFLVGDDLGYGLYDAYGNEVIGTDKGYDYIRPEGYGIYSKDTWFSVLKNGLYGVCLIWGLQIIPPEYKYIYHSPVFGFQAKTVDGKEITLGMCMTMDGLKFEQKSSTKEYASIPNETTSQIASNHNSHQVEKKESQGNIDSNPTFQSCKTCEHTDGKCFICHGLGRISWAPFYMQCTACYGTGKCPMCHGTRIWIPGTENVPMSTGSSGESSSNGNSTTRSHETTTSRVCSTCHGTGYESTRRTAPSYGEPKIKKYCSICKGEYYSHYHNPCSVCHGTGQRK